MADTFIGTEATGVYVGYLLEDMVETVKREKKLYCDVYIEKIFGKDGPHPLTLVPFWALSLPLKKDDKAKLELTSDFTHLSEKMFAHWHSMLEPLLKEFCGK